MSSLTKPYYELNMCYVYQAHIILQECGLSQMVLRTYIYITIIIAKKRNLFFMSNIHIHRHTHPSIHPNNNKLNVIKKRSFQYNRKKSGYYKRTSFYIQTTAVIYLRARIYMPHTFLFTFRFLRISFSICISISFTTPQHVHRVIHRSNVFCYCT